MDGVFISGSSLLLGAEFLGILFIIKDDNVDVYKGCISIRLFAKDTGIEPADRHYSNIFKSIKQEISTFNSLIIDSH